MKENMSGIIMQKTDFHLSNSFQQMKFIVLMDFKNLRLLKHSCFNKLKFSFQMMNETFNNELLQKRGSVWQKV